MVDVTSGADPAAPPKADAEPHGMLGPHDPGARARGFWGLALGSVGVVFGDIGTSPLYAMREALAHSRNGGTAELAVLGVVSLVFWALIIVVTVKYVVFLMRADNKGEGGTLALMALAQRARGRHSMVVFVLGMCGAALFYSDGIITPAVSVISAMEGLGEAPGVGRFLAPYILPSAVVILVGLFMVQSHGTASVARYFGPITAVWFLTLAGLGLLHIGDEPSVLRGLLPHYGVLFLLSNGALGFVILGSVFLAVTGAEALYADMGHFGKGPIRAAWVVLVLPCLVLNYLGQGALVLSDPATAENPFFRMIPEIAYWPVLLLATAATIIASQAVITGAFSLTQQAVQLGLLPRVTIKRTSEHHSGQIFVPAVNVLLLIGVIVLLVMLRTSSNLAAAYGIAVTGAMFVDTLLFFVVVRFMWKRPLWQAWLAVLVFGFVDVIFLGSNLLKIPQGAWIPLVLGSGLVLIMWTWWKGAQLLAAKTRKDDIPLADVIATFKRRPPSRVAGNAVFLTADPHNAPTALMHNLKHNRVLHHKNVLLSIRTTETPRVAETSRVKIAPINDDFIVVTADYGFMELPSIPRVLAECRRCGLKLDMHTTSFFLTKRTIVPTPKGGMPAWQDKLFGFLLRNAASPTDFFRLPPSRVVEMGAQLTV